MDNIEWREIPGLPGYQVSSDGQVWWSKASRTLRQHVTKRGYLTVSILDKHRITHRLVALAFHPNPECKPCVNHINGIKDDNRVENLEWCSYKENAQHAQRTGLYKQKRGEESGRAKLTEKDVREIKDLVNSKPMPQKDIAKMYGVSDSVVSSIKKGTAWKHM